MASARVAVERGFAIRLDHGPSGRLGHWAIAGLPDQALAVLSKRSAEIDQHCATAGHTSYQARGVAARESRKAKGTETVGELVPRWRAELTDAGFPVPDLVTSVAEAAREQQIVSPWLDEAGRRRLVEVALDPAGPLAERKVFSRRDVAVAVAPALFGRDPGELDRVVDRVLASPEAVPLLGVAGARERAYGLASVLATEQALADSVERGTGRSDAARAEFHIVSAAIERAGTRLERPLTVTQSDAVAGICLGGAGVDLVVGVAGSGKTTVLGTAAEAFASSGHRVVGTATSGQAARTLAEAGLVESRTLASVLWRLDHRRLTLDQRSVVILDESGMTEDAGLLRLLSAAEVSGAKVVLVGDDRQLGSVGPGGALRALVERHGEAVHVLGDNLRQRVRPPRHLRIPFPGTDPPPPSHRSW